MRLNTDEIEELIYSAITTVYLRQREACHCFFSDVDCVHLNSGVPNTMVQLEFVYATLVCVGFFWVLWFDLTIQSIQHRRVVQETLVPWQDTEAAHCSNAGSKFHCTSCTMGPLKYYFPPKDFFFNRGAVSKPNLLKAHTLQLFTHWPIKFPF